MSATISFIGIDVGCRTLSAAVPGAVRDFPHTPAGARDLVRWAQRRLSGELRAVCESSGPYSKKLALLLAQLNVPCAIVPPQRVRANAAALGRRCKTDRVDAAVILDYAMHVQPPAWDPPPATQAQLAALHRADLSLKAEQRRWRNRRHGYDQLEDTPAAVRELAERMDAHYAAERQVLKRELEALLEAPELAADYALLRSIPGVGPQTALVLLSQADILRTRTDKQLAAYAGLAPMHRRSGSSLHAPSRIAPGNSELRTLLYMAALTAKRYAPLQEFYGRLSAGGKPPKVALIAVARKLLLMAAAVLKAGVPFHVPDSAS